MKTPTFIASFSMPGQCTKKLLSHWDDPEGQDGQGSGRGFQDGEHVYTHG